LKDAKEKQAGRKKREEFQLSKLKRERKNWKIIWRRMKERRKSFLAKILGEFPLVFRAEKT